MEENQTLGLKFYIYVLVEIALAVLGLWAHKNGYYDRGFGHNILPYILLVQTLVHLYMIYDGYIHGKSKLYSNFFPFSVPAIVIVLIAWINTF